MALAAGPNVASVASLMADAGRARMLFALLDGREASATSLASVAGVSPQSASAHLHRLVAGGLLEARSAGRQRLFRLASVRVAAAIESLASIAPAAPVTSMSEHSTMERLREARSCYDHLAGRLGVGITDALLAKHAIALRLETFRLTRRGERFFSRLGIDIDAVCAQRRAASRACMDWTERRYHLAGGIGAALLHRVLDEGWLKRSATDRSLRVTATGRTALPRVFGVRLADETA